jgi:hypothetical protein
MAKNTKHAVKAAKHLGQGGPMKWFLNYVHPFTRTLRLVVACWRWIESAQCRRGEVGTEEAFVSSLCSAELTHLTTIHQLISHRIFLCLLPPPQLPFRPLWATESLVCWLVSLWMPRLPTL